MKLRYIHVVGFVALLTITLIAFKKLFGHPVKMDVSQVTRSNKMDVSQVSNLKAKAENVLSYIAPTQKSQSAIVGVVVSLILCAGGLYHVIAFFVWKSQFGKRYKETMLSKYMDMPTRYRCFRDYRKITYSDDEENLLRSDIQDTPYTLSSLKSTFKVYKLWLYFPLFIFWTRNNHAQSVHRVGPHGLKNLGNTCYFNSVMQILANTYILHTSIHENKYRGEFNRRFERFCRWMNDRQVEPNSGWNLWHLLCSKIQQLKEPRTMHSMFSSKALRFDDQGQHDSHECLRHFLDELRKEERECRKNSLLSSYDPRKSLTVVDKVFGGHFITVYTCLKCGSPYHIFEPFLDISLPICLVSINPDRTNSDHTFTLNLQTSVQAYAKASAKIMTRLSDPLAYNKRQFQDAQGYSINDCLWYFTRTEHILNEYLCKHCCSMHTENISSGEGLTSATKQTLIFNPPAVLTIHLKRFEVKPGRSEKRSDRIRYEELLDIAPYCSESCLRNDPPEKKLWYSLYGIVVHSGSLEFGHYYAYIKIRHDEPDMKKFLQEEYFDRDTTKDQLIKMMEMMEIRRNQVRGKERQWSVNVNEGIWFCMNDNWVSEVTVDEVLNQEAYLLFYERI